MKVVLRADAGVQQGTGHVMRCLTLAEELVIRGHEVHLVAAPIAIPWLRSVVANAGLTVHECVADDIAYDTIMALAPDWLVVDSYQISAEQISRINAALRVLAIVDGDERSIEAALYLDQNLGAEKFHRAKPNASRFLLGSDYSLIRRAVLDARRPAPWNWKRTIPNTLCFMGGTDPSGCVIGVAEALSRMSEPVSLTIVAPKHHHERLMGLGMPMLRVVPPTPDLPVLLSKSDLVISAAGTSAWDICTLGIPAVFVAVVDNQVASLHSIIERDLALGVDLVSEGDDALGTIGTVVSAMLADTVLRERLSRSSLATFDGRGATRVVIALEEIFRRGIANPLASDFEDNEET